MTTTDLPIVLARLEVKLDQILAQAGDHESRLRKLEEGPCPSAPMVQDHEGRMRLLEARRWPLHLVSVAISGIALAGSLGGVILAR